MAPAELILWELEVVALFSLFYIKKVNFGVVFWFVKNETINLNFKDFLIDHL